MNDKKQNVTDKNVDNKKNNLHIIKSNMIKENNKKDNKDNKSNKVINALMDKDNDNNENDIHKDNKTNNEKKEDFFKYNFENSEKIDSIKDFVLIKNTIGQENIQPMNQFQNKRKNNFGKKLYEMSQENKLIESKEEEEEKDSNDNINNINRDTNEKKEKKEENEDENLENIRKIQKGELDLTYNFDDDVFNVTQEQMDILGGDVNKIYNKYQNIAKLKHFKIKHPYFQNSVKMINNNIEFIIPKLSKEEKKKRISPIIEKQKLILEKIKKNNISRSNMSLSNNSNTNTIDHTINIINQSNRIKYPYSLNQQNNNNNNRNLYTNTNTNTNMNINLNVNQYENNNVLKSSFNHYNLNNNNYRYNNNNIISYKNQNNIQRYQNLFNYAPLTNESRSNDKIILNDTNKRKIIYEPYTLVEYKKKYDNLKNDKKLGGLGANLGGEEWVKRQKLMERKKQYSDYVKNDNDEDFKKLNNKKLKLKTQNYEITNTISSKKSSEISRDRLSEPIHKRYNAIKTENNIGNSKQLILPLIKERFINKSQKKNYKINTKRNSGNNHNNNDNNKFNSNLISFDGIYTNNGNEKDLKELIKQYEENNGKW